MTALQRRFGFSSTDADFPPIGAPVPPATVIAVRRAKSRATPRSADLAAEITPDLVDKIDKVAGAYSSALDGNRTGSLLEDLSTLFQLISGPYSPELQARLGVGVDNLSEQVYFVMKVLSLQLTSCLSSVDPGVVSLLVEKYPHRISKPIRKHWGAWAEAQEGKRNLLGADDDDGLRTSKPSEFHDCVTFRSELDGRSNFPSQWEFHAFCKQRDLFYSIKNGWKERERGSEAINNGPSSSGGHNNSSSSSSPFFANVPQATTTRTPTTTGRLNTKSPKGRAPSSLPEDPLASKIKTLFQINSSWANLSHFAGLLTAQYVLDSVEESRKKSRKKVELLDESMKSLQISNPDRFAKLNSRLSSGHSEVEKQEEGEGGRESESFSFVAYFLKNASSHVFNQHLIDWIIFEIRQMETSLDTSIGSEIGKGDAAEVESLLKKAVLLARLLGYVYFLPYREDPGTAGRSSYNVNSLDKEALSNKHLEIRKNQTPPFDIIATLKNANQASRLTFSLPWILQFLMGADYVSLQLMAYKEALRDICSIYHTLLTVDGKDNKIALGNKNFLRFWCGTLFSHDHFPLALLYEEASFQLPSFLKGKSHPLPPTTDKKKTRMSNGKSEEDVVVPQSQRCHDDDGVAIDKVSIIGERLTRQQFSSAFNHMKHILHTGLQQQQPADTQDPRNRKRIRPIPAQAPSGGVKSKTLSPKTILEKQLECSFFDGNSPSVKRTVDFISERVASNYVKHLRQRMLDQRKALALKSIFGEDAATICRNSMLSGIPSYIASRCEESVALLIGDGESLSGAALGMCQQITERQANEKITEWIYIHIKGEMFPEVPVPEPSSIPSPTTTNNVKQGEGTAASKDVDDVPVISFSTLSLLHRSVKKLHEGKEVAESTIDDLLNASELSLSPGLSNMLVDFGVTLIVFCPLLLNERRVSQLISLWRPIWSNETHHLLSPRNVQFIKDCSGEHQKESWGKMEEISKILLNEGMTSFESLEQDSLALLRQNLSPDESRHVSQLLRRLTSSNSSRCAGEDDAMSREVVDWVSWVCSDECQEGEF